MNFLALNTHVSSILIYSITLFKFVICSSCSTAQVGSYHTFREVFQHTVDDPLKIAWIKDGHDVSHCIPGLDCSDTNEKETTTKLNHLGNRSYEFQLVVHKITDKDAGLWSLVYFGPAKRNAPIFVCQLKLKGRPTTSSSIVQLTLAVNTQVTPENINYGNGKQVTDESITNENGKQVTDESINNVNGVQVTDESINNRNGEQVTDENIDDGGNGEQVTLLMVLSVVSILLVLIVTMFFLIFRCRIKIYSRFTRRREGTSQTLAHVYESIEVIHTSSQDTNYRYANLVRTFSNSLVTEKSDSTYITVI